MKRAGRWLFNLAASLSLVLFVAVCALWARSYFVVDRIELSLNGPGKLPAAPPALLAAQRWPLEIPAYLRHYAMIESAGGSIGVANLYPIFTESRNDFPGVLWAQGGRSRFRIPQMERFSFGWGLPKVPFTKAVVFPHWVLALAALALPAIRLRKWLVKRRAPKPGFCNVCGYDLRATPDRCPECGTAVTVLCIAPR